MTVRARAATIVSGWVPIAAAALAAFAAWPASADSPRPRVTIQMAEIGPVAPNVALTGAIEARYQSQVAFRIGGKIAERLVEVGSHIGKDQVLARIVPDQQQSDLRSAQATLASAEAARDQARTTFERQTELMKSRFTTQSSLDDSERQFRSAQAQVDAARSQVDTAAEQLGYTELRAGVDGIVTDRNAEVGQVVQAGTPVFTVAQDGPRDAVFTVYEGLLVQPPESRDISVSLQADPSVKTTATVREISPTVDVRSGGVTLKATLASAPPRMTLGASVVGLGTIGAARAITVPWSALFRWNDGTAVWVIDAAGKAQPQPVVIARFADGGMVIRSGLEAGNRVVTAGVQFLRPGVAVDVVKAPAP